MSARKVALVTGGPGGIGAAVCWRLAKAGACVAVSGRRLERAEALCDELASAGYESIPLQLDVAEPASISAAIAKVRSRVGPVDWLVNNAGIAVSAPLLRGSEQGLFERHMDVNFHGARRVFEAVLPGMLERGYGRVVQVASSAALVGYAYVAAYAASKHALLGYTRSAALELRGKGVGLGAICPHYVDSPMTEASVQRVVESTGRSEEDARGYFASQNPGGRLVAMDEVAQAAFDLLEDERTGRVLELTGGETLEVDAGWSMDPAQQ